MFAAFQVEHGYVGIKDVRKAPPKHDDTQQSFFLAETLKYLYLMFGDGSEFDLNEWVFNTEAHPLKIMELPPELDAQRDATRDESPVALVQEQEPDVLEQKAPDVIIDVVDASLADAVADEDRANLNTLHDTLDRSTDDAAQIIHDPDLQQHTDFDVLSDASQSAAEVAIDQATAHDLSTIEADASVLDDRTE